MRRTRSEVFINLHTRPGHGIRLPFSEKKILSHSYNARGSTKVEMVYLFCALQEIDPIPGELYEMHRGRHRNMTDHRSKILLHDPCVTQSSAMFRISRPVYHESMPGTEAPPSHRRIAEKASRYQES